jgi:HAD superfamily hydrolase (TIGR01509 family)
VPLQGVLFDMDGTLVDSEVIWVDAIATALRGRGVIVSQEEASDLVYGHAWPDIFREIARRYPGVYASRQAMEAVTVPLYARCSGERDIRIQPSINLLRALARRYPIAIVSGSTRSRIQATIADVGIADCVAAFVSCEDVPAGKPDPAAFLLGAARLGVAPAACLVFEDSTAGVLAAKAAGMRCVALARDNARGQDLTAADAVLPSLDAFDLERFLAAWPA